MSFPLDFGLELRRLRAQGDDVYWKDFIDEPQLCAGIMRLSPTREDTQSPHSRDEVYFILEGDGVFSIDGKDHEVEPMKVFLVRKGREHRFHSNSREIVAFYCLGYSGEAET